MAITLPDARELSDEALDALRLRALRGRELGFTEADLADPRGVSREAVCRRWRDYTIAEAVSVLVMGSRTWHSRPWCRS